MRCEVKQVGSVIERGHGHDLHDRLHQGRCGRQNDQVKPAWPHPRPVVFVGDILKAKQQTIDMGKQQSKAVWFHKIFFVLFS